MRLTIIDRMDRAALTALLNARFQQAAGKSLDFSLVGFINKRLIPVILKVAGFQDLKRPAVTLTPEEIGRIGRILTDWRFPVRGTKSWPSAQ